MTSRLFIRAVSIQIALAIMFSALAFEAQAQQKRKTILPGQKAVVIDERLSALRAQPDVKAELDQRLRRGRLIGVTGATTNKNGARFLRVAVTRNTRGWILAEAVARQGNAADAEKLMSLIEETKDDFTKARLADLYANQFRATASASKALLILGESGEKAAEKLTRDANRRVGGEEPGKGLSKRDYYLNFSGLDRYNRIDLKFDYDEATERIVYDGAAYRELIKRYPRSEEAKQAQAKMESLAQKK